MQFLERTRRKNIEQNVDSLSALGRVLQERGVKMVFLTLPSHPSYAKERPPEWDALAERAAAEAATTIGEQIPWWNLRQDPRLTGDEFFQNPDHLNKKGAIALSEVLKPLLRELSAPVQKTEERASEEIK